MWCMQCFMHPSGNWGEFLILLFLSKACKIIKKKYDNGGSSNDNENVAVIMIIIE